MTAEEGLQYIQDEEVLKLEKCRNNTSIRVYFSFEIIKVFDFDNEEEANMFFFSI